MARTKKSKPGDRARRQAAISCEALEVSSTTVQATSVHGVEQLATKFNESVRRWNNHKAHVKTQVDPLKEALRSAQSPDRSHTVNMLELTGAVEEFEELVSNICTACDGGVAYAITTREVSEQPGLEIPEFVNCGQVDGSDEAEPVQLEVSSIEHRDKGGSGIEELEQVITGYQNRAVACIEVGLKVLAKSISKPSSATDVGHEELVNENEHPYHVADSRWEPRRHALSEMGDQTKVILERTRLLSTNLVYGSWNAACELLETCDQHTRLPKSETRPDIQLIKEELQYVLDGAGDLRKLFNIDAAELQATLQAAEAHPRPSPVALIHTKPTGPIFELTVNVLGTPDFDAPIVWQSQCLRVLADRCKKMAKANNVVNWLCEDELSAVLAAPNSIFFNLFHVEVRCAANPTKRISVKGPKAWFEWFTAIAQQPHGDAIKVTFWFHGVANAATKGQGGSKKRKLDRQGTSSVQVPAAKDQGQLFRATEWMKSG